MGHTHTHANIMHMHKDAEIIFKINICKLRYSPKQEMLTFFISFII